ncbi:MAG: molybdopterin-dependent oxidoreductase [Thermomicrobiales bacterium]
MSAAIGMASGVVVTATWWLLYSGGLLTFPPFDLGDVFIRQSPGSIATWAIETLGARAQPAALAGGVIAWIAGWGLLGLVVGSAPATWRARLAPLCLLPIALGLGWWSESDTGAGRVLWLLLAFGVSLLAAGALLSFWLVRLEEALREAESPAESWLDHPGDFQRRELLRRIAIVTIVGGGGSALAGWLARGVGTVGVETSASTPLLEARAALASPIALPTSEPAEPLANDFTAPAGVRPRVTSNDEFYVVDISTRDPTLDEMGWVLRVHGLVDRELLITWKDLLSLPSIELDGTLMCISYEHDNGLISTTRWTGVALRDIFERAGVRDGVVDVVCRGASDYSDSIPLAKALEATTLLAYGMNGTTLPRSHGFPCRLYVPGLYGEKNVKWLQEIELVGYDYKGFWQERGWTDLAVVNTVAIIDTPRDTLSSLSDVVGLGGIAFAGDRGIETIQVRINDGDWQAALLEANHPPLIWQRWRFDWRPQPGSHRVTVRAVDGAGNPQLESERSPHPDGMTGLHSVVVDVV